jgi:hypothetical protein
MLRRSVSDRGENRDPGVATKVHYKSRPLTDRAVLGVSRRTAVLIVPLLIVDIKPGVYDARLRGSGA